MANVPTIKELQKLRVVDLKERLSQIGVSTSGLKADLVSRLHEVLLQQSAEEEEAAELSGESETNDSPGDPFKDGDDSTHDADDHVKVLFEQQKEALALEQVRLLEEEKAKQDEELIERGKHQQQLLEGDVEIDSKAQMMVETQKHMIAVKDKDMIERGKQQQILIEEQEVQERIMVETQQIMLAQIKEEYNKEDEEKTKLAEQQHQIIEQQKLEAPEPFQVVTFAPVTTPLPQPIISGSPVLTVIPEMLPQVIGNISSSIPRGSILMSPVIVSVPEMVQGGPQSMLVLSPVHQEMPIAVQPPPAMLPIHIQHPISISSELPLQMQIPISQELSPQMSVVQQIQMKTELQPQLQMPQQLIITTEISPQIPQHLSPKKSTPAQLLPVELPQPTSPAKERQIKIERLLSPEIRHQINIGQLSSPEIYQEMCIKQSSTPEAEQEIPMILAPSSEKPQEISTPSTPKLKADEPIGQNWSPEMHRQISHSSPIEMKHQIPIIQHLPSQMSQHSLLKSSPQTPVGQQSPIPSEMKSPVQPVLDQSDMPASPINLSAVPTLDQPSSPIIISTPMEISTLDAVPSQMEDLSSTVTPKQFSPKLPVSTLIDVPTSPIKTSAPIEKSIVPEKIVIKSPPASVSPVGDYSPTSPYYNPRSPSFLCDVSSSSPMQKIRSDSPSEHVHGSSSTPPKNLQGQMSPRQATDHLRESSPLPVPSTPPKNASDQVSPHEATPAITPPLPHQDETDRFDKAIGHGRGYENEEEEREVYDRRIPHDQMPRQLDDDEPYDEDREDEEYHLPSAIEKVLALQNERAQQVDLEAEKMALKEAEKAKPEPPKLPAPIRSLVSVDEGEDDDDMEDEDALPQTQTPTQKAPKESKNKRRKDKKKRARQRRVQQREQDELKEENDKNKENSKELELDVEIEYVPDTHDQPKDPLYFQFLRIFEKFKLLDPEKPKEELSEEKQKEMLRQEEIMNRLAERKKPADIDEKDDDDDDKKEEEKPKLSKRKLKKLNRMSVAELKQKVGRPELVEMHDVTAKDPVLLLHLKAARNSVPVPRHWCFKRKYLQGKRGIEKPPFDLPDFIKKTGIMEMRQALQEKEEQKTMKAKMRERVRPKMGKIDIDYQKLHDAFFKWQIKPRMTIHGDLYYEGKEFETRLKEKKPGDLSEELRMALGMPTGPNQNKCPPPWLIAMQRYGPPPSYPNLKIPGLNAPIPDGCSFGYHAGGWGKPPVDEMGRPLYGDVFGTAMGDNQIMMDEEVDRSLWGELESESSEESEEESEEEEEEEKPEDESGLVTPAEGLVTPSGLSSVPAGMETPDMIELRKRKIEAEMEGGETPALYTILPEKNVEKVGGAMMGSTHIYDITAAMPAAKARGVTGAIAAMMPPQGVEVTLDPSELEMDSVAMAARYEQTVREQQSQLAKEDLSDMVAEHAARQKNKRKKQQQDTSSKTAKKYKEFKF